MSVKKIEKKGVTKNKNKHIKKNSANKIKKKKSASKKSKSNKLYKIKSKKNNKTYSIDDSTTSALEKINRLENIHNSRKNYEMISDKIAFWIFLIISLITNFSLSFILLFLIIFLKDPLLYIIVIIIGLGFGLVYNYMINSLRYSLFHHHAFSKIFILLTGTINIIYIVTTSKIVFDFIGINNSIYNQIGIPITYFIAYLVPYFFQQLVKFLERSENI